MGAISDSDDDLFVAKAKPATRPSIGTQGTHKKFMDDPEATTVTREELDEIKKMALENKRRSLENEARSKIAQERSLENQKRLLGQDKEVVEIEPAEPKPKRGRPAKKDKSKEPKEVKPKTQAQIAKEIKQIEAELKKVQKQYSKEMDFLKDQKAVMTQYKEWFTELADKPDFKKHAPVLNKINHAVQVIYGLRDQLEEMDGYNYPELNENGHPLFDLQTYLLAVGNTMNTTGVMGHKEEHKRLKVKRQKLLDLLKPVDEFELK